MSRSVRELESTDIIDERAWDAMDALFNEVFFNLLGVWETDHYGGISIVEVDNDMLSSPNF